MLREIILGCVCQQDFEDYSSTVSDTDDTNTGKSNSISTKELSVYNVEYVEDLYDRYEMSTNGLPSLDLDPCNSHISEINSPRSLWTWPQGFDPPSAWKLDEHKVLIHRVEIELESTGIDYHEIASRTFFGLDKKTICRYLEACQWNENPVNGKTVAQRIIDTIQWRSTFPIPVVDRILLCKELCTGKYFVHGRAKSSSPILYIIPAKENTWDVTGNVLSMLYTVERAVQCMDASCLDVVCVIDCKDVGMMNAPKLQFVTELIETMGKHMPRRLGRLFICNVSAVFYFLWNVISKTLSETTRQKIQLLSDSPDEIKKTLRKYIDADVLLKAYGGRSRFNFAIDAYLDEDPFLSDPAKRFVYS
eukprot:gene4374-8715_t